MDMKALYGDFKNHVDDMTDDDIKKSIDNAINNSLDEFISFAKDEYDLTITPIESDTFEKIFYGEE